MAIILKQNIWTKGLTAQMLTIDSSYGLNTIEITLINGDGTITGSSTLPNGVTSSAVALVLNVPITISTSTNSVISFLEIDALLGKMILIGK